MESETIIQTGRLIGTIGHQVWLVFLFVLGACVGSFLNVVVYRVPEGISLVRPGSHCPCCKEPIRWYDNIPILSWFILRGRCRRCGARFSIQYAMVELATGVMFAGFYWLYFVQRVREGLAGFTDGGWVIYGGHVLLLCCLLAGSLIDGRHWIIPLSISYTAAIGGVLMSVAGAAILAGDVLMRSGGVVPWCGDGRIGGMAVGAVAGIVIGLLLVRVGILKRSFSQLEGVEEEASADVLDNISARREMMWEMAFLAPAVVLAMVLGQILGDEDGRIGGWWCGFLDGHGWLCGLLGSVFGFMIGGAVVWGTRILGSLAFGKEAMGLGDVHLMAGAGAVLGWQGATVAFFVAPFFGLGWAVSRLITQKKREIPYGPFLSMALVIVMVEYDWIIEYLRNSFGMSGLGP